MDISAWKGQIRREGWQLAGRRNERLLSKRAWKTLQTPQASLSGRVPCPLPLLVGVLLSTRACVFSCPPELIRKDQARVLLKRGNSTVQLLALLRSRTTSFPPLVVDLCTPTSHLPTHVRRRRADPAPSHPEYSAMVAQESRKAGSLASGRDDAADFCLVHASELAGAPDFFISLVPLDLIRFVIDLL